MSQLYNMVAACTDDSEEFHGYRVRLRDLADLLANALAQKGKLPPEMWTIEGVSALVHLLRHWDLVRTYEHDGRRATRETTDNRAYLEAPEWLRAMLAGTSRRGTSIQLTNTEPSGAMLTWEGTSISSEVPGFHAAKDQPGDTGKTIAILTEEIERQAKAGGIPPGAGKPRVTGLSRPYLHKHYMVDFGTLDGVHHQTSVMVDGGHHRSEQDIAAIVSEVMAELWERVAHAGRARDAVVAITKHVQAKLRKTERIEMGHASVSKIEPHGSGRTRFSVELDIHHPDHSYQATSSVVSTSATADDAGGKWDVWNPALSGILTNVRRTLLAGTSLTVDPVVRDALWNLPEAKRVEVLGEVLSKPGTPAEHMTLKNTGLERLRVLHGSIGGTVVIAPGITWVDGSLRVKRELLDIPDTVAAALSGRMLTDVLVHAGVPETRIERVRVVDAAYYFVTDLRPVPFDRPAVTDAKAGAGGEGA